VLTLFDNLRYSGTMSYPKRIVILLAPGGPPYAVSPPAPISNELSAGIEELD